MDELLDSAGNRGPNLYRIELGHGGPDPQIALRSTTPEDAELDEIKARLRRLDLSASVGPWTEETLRLIGEKPGVRAADLARSLGREKMPFKLDVRKLKELGLTESLEMGYRLSPRGQAVMAALSGESG